MTKILRLLCRAVEAEQFELAKELAKQAQKKPAPRVPRSRRPAAVARNTKRKTKAQIKAANRDHVRERAAGQCEAYHRSYGGDDAFRCYGRAMERDHFWGQGKDESVEGSWMLCLNCHYQKTNNIPNRVSWLGSFGYHLCQHEGAAYGVQAAKVKAALALENGQHPGPTRQEGGTR